GHVPNHWVKLRLSDERSLNRFAIGARVTAYGPTVSATRVVRDGGCAGSASSTDMIFGLGREGALESVDIEWPRKDRAPRHYSLPMVRDQLVCIERQRGVIPCK
ncbi:MAG TPA: ASPIC/UnbV domain-containing protein, partial [Polyangia bacterium]